MTTPTPDEARQALRDVADRRRQTAAEAGSPRWFWIAGGAGLIAWGVLRDLAPGFWDRWGQIFFWLLIAFLVAAGTRRGGALIGRRVRVRAAGTLPLAVFAAALLLLIAVVITMAATGVPHADLWMGVLCGLAFAVGGPVWQSWVLKRQTGA
jgi:hypothetical protein